MMINMTMHTRHWIFGIGLPVMGAAQILLMSLATPGEAEAAQQATSQFSIWIGMAVQMIIGVADWIKNNNKQNPPSPVIVQSTVAGVTPS